MKLILLSYLLALISIGNAQIGVGSYADLRARLGTGNSVLPMLGASGEGGLFGWCDTCTEADDGVNYIRKSTWTSGKCWKRIIPSSSYMTEGSNQFYTDTKSRTAFALTTTGSGVSTYNNGTGAFNIPLLSPNMPVSNKAGSVTSSAILFVDTFSISSAQPTIDLSSYITANGKTSCRVFSAVGFRVSATTSNSPNVSFTGWSTTGAPLIFNQTNTNTVTILGISVLSGLPTVLVPDPTNVKVVIGAYFY